MIDCILNCRFVKLHISLNIIENSILPSSKASAIRGGLGEMLLRANCIRDRKCEACDFESECIVQRTMYSKFEHKPDFVSSGDSIGYVVECEDYREEYLADDELSFNLILFGKTIVYFNQYVQALYALGQNGLGKNHSKFVISSIRNTKAQPILEAGNIYMERYQVQTLGEYVEYRKAKLLAKASLMKIEFKTPLSLKYHGEMLKEFNGDAIVKAVQRRLYILGCFENLDCEEFYRSDIDIPVIIEQEVRDFAIRRYSNRQEAGMYLTGIKGTMNLEQAIGGELLDILIAGEITHIGKNTSFGFGRYVIK